MTLISQDRDSGWTKFGVTPGGGGAKGTLPGSKDIVGPDDDVVPEDICVENVYRSSPESSSVLILLSLGPKAESRSVRSQSWGEPAGTHYASSADRGEVPIDFGVASMASANIIICTPILQDAAQQSRSDHMHNISVIQTSCTIKPSLKLKVCRSAPLPYLQIQTMRIMQAIC